MGVAFPAAPISFLNKYESQEMHFAKTCLYLIYNSEAYEKKIAVCNRSCSYGFIPSLV
jgi:hypothetical protein